MNFLNQLLSAKVVKWVNKKVEQSKMFFIVIKFYKKKKIVKEK